MSEEQLGNEHAGEWGNGIAGESCSIHIGMLFADKVMLLQQKAQNSKSEN